MGDSDWSYEEVVQYTWIKFRNFHGELIVVNFDGVNWFKKYSETATEIKTDDGSTVVVNAKFDEVLKVLTDNKEKA